MCWQSHICNIFTSKFLVTLYKNSLIAFLPGNFKRGAILKRYLYLERPWISSHPGSAETQPIGSAYVQTYNSSSRAVKNSDLLEAVAKELCSHPSKRQIKAMWALTISAGASLQCMCLSSCLVSFTFSFREQQHPTAHKRGRGRRRGWWPI